MPVTFTPDNTAAEARPLAVAPIALPVAPDASSDAYDGTTDVPVAMTAPSAPDNTPPVAIT
jgi:hypothetical protein